jgi:transposase
VKEAIAPHGGRVRVWFMDEVRFGQQGTITDVWATTGSRPRALRQTRYDWVYLYTAVEPATGESAALLAPYVNTGTMNAFLKILDVERKADEHFVLIMDQAGWHKSKALNLPDGITVLLLPPYSPELNPTENLWHYVRSHHLSNRSYEDYDTLMAAADLVASGALLMTTARCVAVPFRNNWVSERLLGAYHRGRSAVP